MVEPSRESDIDISVVVPVFNESESIPRLLDEIDAALSPGGRSYEIIVVDDGSTDGSWEVLARLAPAHPRLHAIRLASNRGQTPALMAGFDASRGRTVVTLDGDLQNDPADIPRLVDKLDEGFEIVSGWRRQRQDKMISRRLPSIVANRISRLITGVTIHDNGCALKAYRGQVLRAVSLYSDFHRFIVPLAQMGGARVAEVETHHRARCFGTSKYGLERTVKVAADLLTLYMVTRYSQHPLRWFLNLAFPVGVLTVIVTVWSLVVWSSATEATQLLVPLAGVVLLMQSLFAILGYGLFAERIRQLAPRRSRRVRGRILATSQGPDGEATLLIHEQGVQNVGLPVRIASGPS
ncbi:MAG: glycosyltransferase family 2 protein [Candidatus Eisenbacteria bacterium]|uniref:Glycosyltransferase family 2 protein n=1 Tax=Eiseniibacteriota bacterium TaxID=2212470 RepID=A0A956RNN2_UNCEI|nr:glycosyltransferase family 2 protein [Candidatus Eisenbacteria bacterium]